MNPSKSNTQTPAREVLQKSRAELEAEFKRHFEIAMDAANELELLKAAEEPAAYGTPSNSADGSASGSTESAVAENGGASHLIGEAEVARQPDGKDRIKEARERVKRAGRRGDYRHTAEGQQ